MSEQLTSQRNGRPPIPKEKIDSLFAAFERGDTPPVAAETCGVHRNTARHYYDLFIAGKPIPVRYEVAATNLTVSLLPATFKKLCGLARAASKTPETLAADIIEAACATRRETTP